MFITDCRSTNRYQRCRPRALADTENVRFWQSPGDDGVSIFDDLVIVWNRILSVWSLSLEFIWLEWQTTVEIGQRFAWTIGLKWLNKIPTSGIGRVKRDFWSVETDEWMFESERKRKTYSVHRAKFVRFHRMNWIPNLYWRSYSFCLGSSEIKVLESSIGPFASTIWTRTLFTIKYRFQLTAVDGCDVNKRIENHGYFGDESGYGHDDRSLSY